MQKALQTLVAACALATVAQAQFSYTVWRTVPDGTRTAYSINPVSSRALEFRAENTLDQSLGNSDYPARFRVTIPEGAFRRATFPKTVQAGSLQRPKIRDESHRHGLVWVEGPEFTETDAIGGWLRQHEHGMHIHEAIDSLVIGTMTEIEPEDSAGGIAAATDARSAPEPASYALFGVMALLGLAVARKWTIVK